MEKIEINKESINETFFKDFVFVINKTLSNAKDGTTIFLEKDVYDLRTTYAIENYCYISNNDHGLKRHAFYLENKSNVVIDGQGSKLNCIGRILPFYMKNCRNITIKNFSIDFERPFISQGLVVASTATTVDLQINRDEYPLEIVRGVLCFIGEDYESTHVHGLLEFYEGEKRPVCDAKDNMIKGPLTGIELENGIIRLNYNFNRIPRTGNILTIKHDKRLVPAITIDSCENVNIENVWIKQSGAMGVVAQLSKNIHLNKVDIYVDPSSERVFSVNADATHFVNCYGEIIVENGRFESMLDDIINVHGNYLKIEKIQNNSTILVSIPHFQQEGFMNFNDGNNIDICEQKTMFSCGTSKIKSVEKINQKYYVITLEKPFEFEDNKTYCIDNSDLYPKVIFRNNRCGKNRARGLILTSTKETIIENNIIDCEGSVIKVNSDMNSWYESSAISKIIVRNNKMTRKNHHVWGKALIDIDPAMDKQIEGEYFHGELILENNEIVLSQNPLFFGYSFKGLQVKNNKIILENGLSNDENFLIQATNHGYIETKNNEYIFV